MKAMEMNCHEVLNPGMEQCLLSQKAQKRSLPL